MATSRSRSQRKQPQGEALSELKSMALSFGQDDLQSILRIAGLSKAGTHSELMTRVCDLLNDPHNPPSLSVQMKIKEVYRKLESQHRLQQQQFQVQQSLSTNSVFDQQAQMNQLCQESLMAQHLRQQQKQQLQQQQKQQLQKQQQQQLQLQQKQLQQQQQQLIQQQLGLRLGQPSITQFLNGSTSAAAYASTATAAASMAAQAAAMASAAMRVGGGGGSLQQQHNLLHNNRFSPTTVPSDPAVNTASLMNVCHVTFTRLPFFDEVATLVKPTNLITRSGMKVQENMVAFTLTTQQIEDISYRDGTEIPRYEVQLRFALSDSSGPQRDDFPSQVNVKVNDRPVILPAAIPSNKAGVEAKRPSLPVNVTPWCTRTRNGQQRMTVTWAAGNPIKNHTVTIVYVRHINATTLLQRLRAKGTRNVDHTRAMIKDKLSLDTDSEIATTSLRVSLLCPLGKLRISLPAKTRECNHLQCFDATLYVQMNEKRPTWQCPVCDGDAHFDKLIIDGYMKEVLEATGNDVVDIELLQDGSWTPLYRDEDNKTTRCNAADKATTGPTPAPVLSLCDDSNSAAGNGTAAADDDPEVIDLSSDDDADDVVRTPAPVRQVPRCDSPTVILLDSPSPKNPTADTAESIPGPSSTRNSTTGVKRKLPSAATPLTSTPKSPILFHEAGNPPVSRQARLSTAITTPPATFPGVAQDLVSPSQQQQAANMLTATAAAYMFRMQQEATAVAAAAASAASSLESGDALSDALAVAQKLQSSTSSSVAAGGWSGATGGLTWTTATAIPSATTTAATPDRNRARRESSSSGAQQQQLCWSPVSGVGGGPAVSPLSQSSPTCAIKQQPNTSVFQSFSSISSPLQQQQQQHFRNQHNINNMVAAQLGSLMRQQPCYSSAASSSSSSLTGIPFSLSQAGTSPNFSSNNNTNTTGLSSSLLLGGLLSGGAGSRPGGSSSLWDHDPLATATLPIRESRAATEFEEFLSACMNPSRSTT